VSATDDQTPGQPATSDPVPEERIREIASRAEVSEGGDADLEQRLDALGDLLGRAYREIHRSDELASTHPRLVEWLLDNEYLVRRSLRQAGDSVPPSFERRLPRLDGEPDAGRVRVQMAARELLALGQYHLDRELLVGFVDTFQEQRPLTTGELWALPAYLRVAALERLAAVTAAVLDVEVPEPLRPAEDREPGAGTAAREVGRCVESLRWLDEEDWRPLFERLSPVERELRRDPSGHYPGMDFESRDRYRKAVEEVASWSTRPEPGVASLACSMAREATEAGAAPEEARCHVGHYLVGDGRAALEERVGARPPAPVRLRRWMLRHSRRLYFGGIGTITALLLFGLSQLLGGRGPTVTLLSAAAVPAVTVAVSVVRWIATHTAPTRTLPKMQIDGDVPASCRTAVVVPCLLGSEEEVDELLEKLEVLYEANGGRQGLTFGLLSDFTDAPEKEMPGDGRILGRARDGVEELNRRYGGRDRRPFFLLHRERLWNPGEGCWMGWERKRGKLEEFNQLVLDEGGTTYAVSAGNVDHLSEVRLALTLDVDTRLPPGEAVRLVGTMAHPLNRPVLDDSDELRSGYSILQPRLQSAPPPDGFTIFARIQEGNTGLDLYSHAVSDVYQDLFGEGIFVGKGIYDVEAFHRTTGGRVPENSLLSHDIFEGICGRAALVSDIVLLEDYPGSVLAYLRRLHRWIRGDWQWLPWLLPRVPTQEGWVPNPFDFLDRWKIADNQIRSLLPPSLVILATVGWVSGTLSPWFWTGLVAAIPGVPIVLGAAEVAARQLFRPPAGGDRREEQPTLRSRVARTASVARLQAERWALSTTLLLAESMVAADAIARTLTRMTITRRHLLEWTTAAQAARRPTDRAGVVWREMSATVAASAGLAGLVGLLRPGGLPAAAPLLAAWLLSPQLSHLISRRPERGPEQLAPEDRRFLREVALRTWMFFERFVTSEDHWLPPDHYREAGGGQVARRTSPTNIGLGLTSTLAAWDFGFVGPLFLEASIRNTLEGMERLERYRGHFLNWYSTRDLSSLDPRYVSTVDSGNLAAALVVVSEGTGALPQEPVLRPRQAETLSDVLGVLADCLSRVGREPGEERERLLERIRLMRARLSEIGDEPLAFARDLDRLADEEVPALEQDLMGLLDRLESGEGQPGSREELRQLRIWSRKLTQQVSHTRREVRTVLPWLERDLDPPAAVDDAQRDSRLSRDWRALRDVLTANPPLEEIPELAERALERLERLEEGLSDPPIEIRDWTGRLRSALETGAENAGKLTADLAEIAEIADRFTREMDFEFLYDRSRDLFHLGFDVSAGELDFHHYDLLASEARLAGLFAVTRGDAPPRHWLHLGRPFGPDGGWPVLLSWGGSMFEYLLPAQFTRTPPDSLLERGYRQAIRAQVRHGRRHGAPWGLSEAAYRKPSNREGYGYRAFGVPALALRRGADDPLVVAPYASALALPFRPTEATRNLERLRERGMLSDYGFYESLDLGPRGSGTEGEPVRAFMAHHQGMTLLGIDNCLYDRPMVSRFHASPGVEAAEHLLHEQAPWKVPVERPWTPPERERSEVEPEPAEPERWAPPEDPIRPQAHILSNGSYRVVVTSAGAGGSYWRDRLVTRWTPDPTIEDRGTAIYLRDRGTGNVWTLGCAARGEEPLSESCEMAPHEVRYRRRQRGLALETRVTVAPDADVEIRHVRLSNSTGRTRRFTVTSYGEVSLASPEDDLRHPAYSRLFVEPEVQGDGRTLLYRRRSRKSLSTPAWAVHYLVGVPSGRGAETVRWETDRERFLGRNGSGAAPRGVTGRADDEEEKRRAASLDPIFSLSADVEIEPFESRELAFVTAAGGSRDDVLDLRARFDNLARVEIAFEDAEAAATERRERLGLEDDAGQRSQELVTALLHPTPGLDGRGAVEREATGTREDLWARGISGDDPILLVRVPSPEEVAFVDRLLRLHREWSELGFRADLVVLHGEPPGYVQRIRDRVEALLDRLGPGPGIGDDGGVHLVSEPGAAGPEVEAVVRAAAVVLDAEAGPLDRQLEPVRRSPDHLPAFVPVPSSPEEPAEETPPLPEPDGLEQSNGYGGFDEDGDYVILRDPDRPTPAPWINVISNPAFGFLASESSLGCTWSQNAGERRLTPWRNDPVLDRPSEAVYLRDEETAEVWSATPLPAGGDRTYRVRHGPGRTSYRHHHAGLLQTLRVTTAPDDPVKIATLEIENTRNRTRRITATYYAEWVLGQRRPGGVEWLVTDYDPERRALLARNPADPEFGQRVAFLTSNLPPHGLTADRTEFLGRSGGLRAPEALDRIGLSDRVPPDADPCAAYQVHLDLEPGERNTVHFVLGDGVDREHALELASTYSSRETARDAARRQREAWEERLGSLTVRTPDEEGLDRLVNRWLPYQTLSSRLWARTAAYQSSGAFGFRDQLQDSLSLLHHEPALAREHLLRAAGRQFGAGDVLHWWQPGGARGVRTRCSDDLLWLPYAAARYVAVTGDRSVLEEEVPYLEGPRLTPGETERYAEFSQSDEVGTLYEHCLRALDRADTSGPHGLPLIGSGDWNDGMNRVGIDGRGESVWLGWFLCRVMRDLADIAERRGDDGRAIQLRERSDEIAARLEEAGWDGAWYRRAYYDDGTPLGSAENREARIDAISQAWSVLSGVARDERAARAMEAVDEHLIRRDDRLVLLLTPPFRETRRDPGYIRSYPPGVRENGGQYTHAAAWVGWAFADLGDAARAREVLRVLNPLSRSETPSDAERYAVEPYVQCADVYGADPFTGRGGWTWYTGSAAWTYRLAVERILGLQRRGDRVLLDPCPPPGWEGWEMRLREDGTEWRIRVRVNGEGAAGVQSLTLDGTRLDGDAFPLRHDGEVHEVEARVGRPEAAIPSPAGEEPDRG